jgi:hypothetical protein
MSLLETANIGASDISATRTFPFCCIRGCALYSYMELHSRYTKVQSLAPKAHGYAVTESSSANGHSKLSSQLSVEWQSDSYILKAISRCTANITGNSRTPVFSSRVVWIAVGNRCVSWYNTCLYQRFILYAVCRTTVSSCMTSLHACWKISRYEQSVGCGRNIMENRPILEGTHNDAWTTHIQTDSMRVQTPFHGLLGHLTFNCWISFSRKALKQSYTMLRESGNNQQVTYVCSVPLWSIDHTYFVFRRYSRRNWLKSALCCCDSCANCSLNWVTKHTA